MCIKSNIWVSPNKSPRTVSHWKNSADWNAEAFYFVHHGHDPYLSQHTGIEENHNSHMTALLGWYRVENPDMCTL